MDRKRIVVIGTSFAGYTAAIELKRRLGAAHDVVVVANSPLFVFIPSLIWVPFGLRTLEEISFDVRPVFDKRGIEFKLATVTGFDLDGRKVQSSEGEIEYDYLLIATGPKVDFDQLPGLGPDRNSLSICTYDHACHTKEVWEKFLEDPGPVVVGATQSAACFGAAYEFILNLRYQLDKHGLADQAPLTFVTAEPFLSHFGIGGFANGQQMCEKLFERYHIDFRTSATVDQVLPHAVVLGSGEVLTSKFTMLIPRFLGIDAVRNTPGLATDAGFIRVDEGYRHSRWPEVYAAGIAVQVDPPAPTPVACGVPKTGYPSEQMAKTAAHNICEEIAGGDDRHELPFAQMKALCVLDTGNMGMMILGDHMLPPRNHEVILPGPQAHWSKLAFEKHFLGTRRRGIV